MRKLFLLALLLFTSPLAAQPTQAQFDALLARVTLLDSIVGTKGFQSTQILCSEMENRRPSTWFPNGDYNLAYRNRQFGCAFDPVSSLAYGLQAQVSGVATRLAVVESRPVSIPLPPASVAAYSDLISYGNGELDFTGKDNGGSRQVGPGGIRLAGDFNVKFGVNNYDAGARVLQNWNHAGTRYLPYATYGNDSRGAFSYNWFPAELGSEYPDNAASSVHSDMSNSLYWPYRGQALVIDGGSQAAYGYLSGTQLYNSRNILIAAQRGGQSIYFAVTPERHAGQTHVQNRALMKLESSSNWDPNPVHIVIDGELRRLRSCDINGQRTVCF